MHKLSLFSFLAIGALLCGAPQAAKAEPKNWVSWILTPPHPDFNRPYLQDGKTPHMSEREFDQWKPEVWGYTSAGKRAVINRLYKADIITGQSKSKGGVRTLEVGDNFMRLSDQEKRRVLQFMDSVYGVTKANGAYEIERDRGNVPVGLYNKYGLQLQ